MQMVSFLECYPTLIVALTKDIFMAHGVIALCGQCFLGQILHSIRHCEQDTDMDVSGIHMLRGGTV